MQLKASSINLEILDKEMISELYAISFSFVLVDDGFRSFERIREQCRGRFDSLEITVNGREYHFLTVFVDERPKFLSGAPQLEALYKANALAISKIDVRSTIRV